MPTVTLVSQSGATRPVTSLDDFRYLVDRFGWRPQFGSVTDALATLSGQPAEPTLTGTVKAGATVYTNGTPVAAGLTVTADAGQIVRWARDGLVDVSADPLATALADLGPADAAYLASVTVPSGGAWPRPPLRPASFANGGSTTLSGERISSNRAARYTLSLFARSDGAGVTGSVSLVATGAPFYTPGQAEPTTIYGCTAQLTGTATLAQAGASLLLMPNDSLLCWSQATSPRVGANVDLWLILSANV